MGEWRKHSGLWLGASDLGSGVPAEVSAVSCRVELVGLLSDGSCPEFLGFLKPRVKIRASGFQGCGSRNQGCGKVRGKLVVEIANFRAIGGCWQGLTSCGLCDAEPKSFSVIDLPLGTRSKLP